MKYYLLLIAFLFSVNIFAHSGNESHTTAKEWTIASENKTISASLMLMKDRIVYLENAEHQVLKFPLAELTLNDQVYVVQRYQQIDALNTSKNRAQKPVQWSKLLFQNIGFIAWGILLSVAIFLLKSRKKTFAFKYAYSFSLVGVLAIFLCFMPKPLLSTDPAFIDSAFVPFKPKVKTRWDATYFYVENLGLPSHPMMKGITNWQQQVPTPQCYTGTNAWSIPLNPVIAATPTPTKTNFFKGAIAIAANGIPIFNALNNRGEDSYVIGELDQYGGHCGKGDDYHYHIAPMSLDSINADILPIAFALDGFAVYAGKEPTGAAMTTLDANHGHTFNGVYHYHGTSDYPYTVGNMVGVVTKDATDQIIPQAQGKPIRPAGNPLPGAAITNLVLTGTNAYKLTYTLSGQSYDVTYSWTTAGAFIFNWGSPSGTVTTNFTGQICTLTTPTDDIFTNDNQVKIYPNPTKTGFSIDLSSPFNLNDIKNISVFDAKGAQVFTTNQYQNFIALPNVQSGIYFVKIQFSGSQLIKKLVVQ